MDIEIICIRRNQFPNDCSCITYVGTYNGEYSVQQVLAMLTIHRFFVRDPYKRTFAFVQPAERQVLRYIRTRPDDDPNDNLLSLPRCSP